MKKLTISDFSGGIQESTDPNDFTPRQWARLKGFIGSDERTFETQWGVQTVGSLVNVTAVYPLVTSGRTFLVAIRTDGTIWWAQTTLATQGYTLTNAVTWSQITTAANFGWADGNIAQPSISILPNTDYKFLCSVPFEARKYTRVPTNGTRDNVDKDSDNPAMPLGISSAVLIHSTTVNGVQNNTPQQALIAFADEDTGTVKAVVFPHIRRFPTHGDEGDFIKANVYDGTNTLQSVGVDDGWPLALTPSVRHQPYTYLDSNAALLPGRGIIPRANVGTTKGGILLLGDIEWRSSFATPATSDGKTYPLLQPNGSALFGTTETTAIWPSDLENTARVLYNEGGGVVYLKNTSGVIATITNKSLDNNLATLQTSVAHNFNVGDKVEIQGVDGIFNGTYTLASGTAGINIRYERLAADIPSTAVTQTPDQPAPRAFSYKYRVEVGAYQTIPNSWNNIYVVASAADTGIVAAPQLNVANHILNDNNTGPYRGGIYFSAGELDTFDPRAVLIPGKTDVQIRGMHVIDDTVIIITTAGSEQDGVYRMRGYLSQLISYSGNSDPTAVRLELIRGGIGGHPRSTNTHKNFSCLWPEAGLVVFVDSKGGVWFTNGDECDRLDRFGPLAPNRGSENNHVAAAGNHLFVYRDNRLLVFSVMASGEGSGNGCWTELNVPGSLTSMVGADNSLYAVRTYSGISRVIRMSPSHPIAERGCIDGIPVDLTVSTQTMGDVGSHKRTVWHRFGMTFSTKTSCTLKTATVQSTGALNIGIGQTAQLPDVEYSRTFNRVYDDPSILGEFTMPAGIGTQDVASATVTFTGYVRLQSASFWITGQTPRDGDDR